MADETKTFGNVTAPKLEEKVEKQEEKEKDPNKEAVEKFHSRPYPNKKRNPVKSVAERTKKK